MGTPLLEFSDGRAAYPVVVQGDVLIGRAATCALRLDVEGVSDKHAQLTLDPLGGVWILDLDSFSGTLRNGEFIYGQTQLDHGDELRLGTVVLRFRGHDGAMPVRDTAAERTEVTELPPEVRAAATAGGEIMRTAKMDRNELNELVKRHPPATSEGPAPLPPPPVTRPAPAPLRDLAPPRVPGPPPRPPAKTVMGFPTPTRPAPPAPPPIPARLPSVPTIAAPRPAPHLPPRVVSGPTPIPVPPVSASVPLPPPAAPTFQAHVGDTAKTAAMSNKGAFGSFTRALTFITQMFTLARANPALLKPLVYDLIVTTPVSIVIAIVIGFVHSRGGVYALLGFGTALLYFADYACNSLTASLVYDYATTGQARLEDAIPRAKKALPGIMTFAAVSALLDVASTYARERDDAASRILMRVVRAIWTTATYVIMPALVIEGISFGDALKRFKELMERDPTGVGAGVVAMSITSYLAAIVIFPLAWFSLRYGSLIHPAVGGTLFFLLVNLYWSVSGWLKISYSTCFYLWARECDRTKTTDHALASPPLRAALDAA